MRLSIFIVSVILTMPAAAYFDYQPGAQAQNNTGYQSNYNHATNAMCQYPGIRMLGAGNIDISNSFGAELPLSTAIRMIIPKGWRIEYNNVKPNQLVSWGPRQPWLDALNEVVMPLQYCAIVNWAQQTVFLSSLNSSVMANNQSGYMHNNQQAQQPIPLPKPEKKWQLDKGDTIKNSLTAWADKANWNLVWELDRDYKIEAPSYYTGSYKEAVSKLITDLAEEGKPIRVKFYENRAARIMRNQ